MKKTANSSHKQLNTGSNLPSLGVSDKAVLSLLPMLRLPGCSATEMEVAFFITSICLFSPLHLSSKNTLFFKKAAVTTPVYLG